MKSPSFVCPPDSAIYRTFEGRAVVCRTAGGLAAVADIVDGVAASGNQLGGVIVSFERPLTELTLADLPDGVPLAIRVPTTGRYADYSPLLPRLRDLDARLYLPANGRDNTTAIQVLASQGVRCGVDFSAGPPAWEALADLAAYALLGRCERASIEPFTFIATHFRPHNNLDWGRTVFDDPNHFLFVADDGRVALNAADLIAGRFVTGSVAEFDDAGAAALLDYRHRWRDFFRDDHRCASCAGWRLCLGRFAEGADDDCSAFFAELVETTTQHHALMQTAPGRSDAWPQ